VPQGLQTLVALLILLPGFVSARIARSLSAQVQQSELERVIEALIFSFFNYVLYIAAFGTSLPIEWAPSFQVHRWLTDKSEIEYVMFLDSETSANKQQ
jgi:hypothetical protein